MERAITPFLSSVSMRIDHWVDFQSVNSVLDVGCNVGALLSDLYKRYTHLELAGVEVNQEALALARKRLPFADLKPASAEGLPFSDASFECVTCIEVLEHVPAQSRRKVLSEVHRVLRDDGHFVLQVPHAGAFDWLDPNNFRFRAPKLYSVILGRGRRDAGNLPEGVVWHHHFNVEELEELVSGLFTIQRVHHGGLVFQPLSDIARWPFYRVGWHESAPCRLLQKVAEWDLSKDYRNHAYDMRLLLKKV